MSSRVLCDNFVSYVVQEVCSHFIDKEIECQRDPTRTSCGHLMLLAGFRVRELLAAPSHSVQQSTGKPEGQSSSAWAEKALCTMSQSHWQNIIRCVSVKAFCLNHFPSPTGEGWLGRTPRLVQSILRRLSQHGQNRLCTGQKHLQLTISKAVLKFPQYNGFGPWNTPAFWGMGKASIVCWIVSPHHPPPHQNHMLES